MLPSRLLKAMLETGEWCVNSTDPKRINLVRVVDPWIVELTRVEDPWLDEVREDMNPTRAVPTDGANCRNIDSADPLVDIIGFRVMGTYARW